MSPQVPHKLSPPVRFAPLNRRSPSRSPSRSPTRQARFAAHELDPLLSNLSPKSTLEALQATEAVPTNEHNIQDVLRKSIAQASTTERALGIRAALAAQKLREWHVELLSWDWPKDNTPEGLNGFQPPPKTDSVDPNEARKEYQGNTVEEGYFGGLTATILEHYEERIDEIRDALEALDVEELKEHVLNAHVHPRSRPSSQHGPSTPSTPSTGTPTKLTYVQLRDFTAVITATILQALPFLAKLSLLLTIWDARVAVSRRIPDLLEGIGTLRMNLDTAVRAIRPLEDTTDRRASFTRERYDSIRASLEEQVSTVGSQMDSLLDTLEGREDTLPQAWIDGLDAIENDFGYWAVQAESVVIENELLQVREAQLHAESVGVEEELKQVRDAKLQAEAEEATAREVQDDSQDKPNADIVVDLSTNSRRSPYMQSDGSDDPIDRIASLEELSPTTRDLPVDIQNKTENPLASIDSVNLGGNTRGSSEGSETTLEASALKYEPMSNDMDVEQNELCSREAHESNRASLYDKTERALQGYASSTPNSNTVTSESDVFFGEDQVPETDSGDMDTAWDPTLADIQRDLGPKQGMAAEHNHLPDYQNKSYDSAISERHELLNGAIGTVDATSSLSSSSPKYFDSDNLEAGELQELSHSNSIRPSVLKSATANGNDDLEAGKHINQPHLKEPIHLHESSAEANASITHPISVVREATSPAHPTKNELSIQTQDASTHLSLENSLHVMDEVRTEESSLRPRDGTSPIQETPEELLQLGSPQDEDVAPTQDSSEANEISPAPNLGALSQDDAYENLWITAVSEKPKDTNSVVRAIAHQHSPSSPSRNLHNLRLSSMPSYEEKRDILTPDSRHSDYCSDFSTPEIKEASTAEVFGTASPIVVASPARKLKKQPASPTTPSRNDSQRTVRPVSVEIESQRPRPRSHHNREPSLVVSESSFGESDETTESGLSDSEMTSVLKRASITSIGHFTPRDIQSVEIRRSGSFSSYRHESPSRVPVSSTSHPLDQKLEDQFLLPPMSHPVLGAKESNHERSSPPESPTICLNQDLNNREYPSSPPLPRRSSKRASILNSPTTLRTPISPDHHAISSPGSSIPLPASSPSKSPSFSRPSPSKVSPAHKPTPAKSTDDHLEQKISSILHTIPARIRLASRPSLSPNPQSPDPDSSSSSNRTTRSSTPTPSITLTPAFTRSSRPNHDTGDSSIRLYNLHTAGREGAPMKLHVRLVGERGERVMVRTGGGWADLGEWLRDYALHHGSRNLSDSKFQVESLPSTSTSTSLGYNGGKSSMSTPASTHSNRSASYGNNSGRVTPGGFRDSVLKTRYPSPTSPIESLPPSNTVDWPPPVPSIPPALISRKPLPGSDPSTPTPTSFSVPSPTPSARYSLGVKKLRSTSTSTPLEPFPNANISNSPLVSTPSELTTSAPQTRRMASNPASPNTTTGLAPGGPKARIASLSAEKQAWIEGMMGAARKVSGTNNLGADKEKAKEKGKVVDRDGEKGGRRSSVGSKRAGTPDGFGDLGAVGGTRRIWLKGGFLKGKGVDRSGSGEGR
jgi:hypothetical protein